MARRLRGHVSGFTIVELLFVVAIAGTLAAIAVPFSLRAVDDYQTQSAARYLAGRIATTRFDAIRRSTTHGLRFLPFAADYTIVTVADGNRNGLRTAEITSGVDRVLTEPEPLSWHFAGVTFGIFDGIPDADGLTVHGTDGVRVGSSRLLAVNADGTATSGTLYLRGRGRSQYAVRVLGITGRVRILKFEHARNRWIDV